MNLAKLAIKRPTFIFSLLIALIIVGFICLKQMSVSMYPDIEMPYVAIFIQYSGAGPEEVEMLVNKRVEDAVSAVSGIKHITSISQDSYGIVIAEFNLSKNPDIALQECKDKLSEIRNDFPDDIKEPVVLKFDFDSMPIVQVALTADLSPQELYDLADDLFSKQLSSVDDVAKVEILGGTKREIWVEVDRNKLKQHDLSLTSFANKISLNSSNIPIGSITQGPVEMAFRTIGEYRSLDQIKNVVVNFMGNDIPVVVKDIANVKDTVEKEASRGRVITKIDGKPVAEKSLILQVYKQSKSNDVRLSDGVRKKVEQLNEFYGDMKGHPQLKVVSDNSWPVRANIEDVERTIYEGIFLAIVVVYFFLGSWRSTFITALALPNSLIGSFVFMYVCGFSMNVLSLMALSLTVGLLIDDAIVVRENIFRHFEEGADPVVAAEHGTNEVALAVIATTLSVIAVFLPIGFMSGVTGQMFREFGLTVVFALVISLADALTIAPLLSAYMITKREKEEKRNTAVKIFRMLTVDWFNFLYKKLADLYEASIKVVLNHKIITMLLAILIFVASLFSAKFIPVTFMPTNEFGEFKISIEAKPGTSLQQMDEYTKQIEAIIENEPDVDFIVTTVGTNESELNKSNLFIKLYTDMSKRTKTTTDFKVYLRNIFKEKFGDTQDLIVSVNDSAGIGNQKPFMLEFRGTDTKQLEKTLYYFMDKIKNVKGLVNVDTNHKTGKPEQQIVMDTAKMDLLGVHSVTAGMELRYMVEGAKPAKLRQNGIEYDIRVKLQPDQEDIIKDFEKIYVGNVNNKLVKIKNVSKVVDTTGPTKIYRKDRSKFVNISANLDKGAGLADIQSNVSKMLKEEFAKPENAWMKGVTYAYSGNSENMKELVRSMIIAALLSLIFIYMVLASLYESIIIPFVIMSALPLALIGGLVGLLITGQNLSMFGMIGFIMLLGIVAKNSILLVDYIQQMIRKGMSVKDAIVESGKKRLRPILMTSIALSAGMLPTALGLSESGKFRMSMGIVVIGGVVSSTLLTLLVVPAIFEYLNRFRLFTRRILGRPEKRMIDIAEDEAEATANAK